MKKFTCPCFVLVENAERHKELIKLLDSIGYDKSPIQCSGNIIGVESQGWFVDTWVSDYQNIDCGTNVELFKALAAMNDTDDYMQWLIRPDINEFWLCKDKCMSISFGTAYRKATKEEIIKHFTK